MVGAAIVLLPASVTLHTWLAEASQLIVAQSVSVVALKFCVAVYSCAVLSVETVFHSTAIVHAAVLVIVVSEACHTFTQAN